MPTATQGLNSPRRAVLEELAAEGYLQTDAAAELGVTSARVAQLLIAEGLHATWKRNRWGVQADQRRAERRRQILALLKYRQAMVARVEGWAHGKAVEYLHAHRRTAPVRYDFPDLVTLFSRYHVARQAGSLRSFEQLREGLPFDFVQVGKILRVVGLPPLYGKYSRSIYRVHVPFLRRAAQTPLSERDIAHFLQLPACNVGMWYFRHGVSVHGAALRERSGFTYRLLSQVYEAQDAALSIDETVGLLSISPMRISTACNHRSNLEPVITGALQHLFDDGTIAAPYVSPRYAKSRPTLTR